MNVKPGDCPREAEAIAAARSGRWTSEWRSHVAGCADCKEAVMVVEALRQALPAEDSAALPSAGQVWWRAQIQARRADAERAVRPVRVVQTIASAFAVLSPVLLVLRYTSQLQQWLLHLPAAAGSLEQPLVWLLGTAAMFVAAVSAGLGFMRRSSK